MASFKIFFVLLVAFAAVALGAEQRRAARAPKDIEASDLSADSTYGLGYSLGHGGYYPYSGYYGGYYGNYPYYGGYSKYSAPYTTSTYHGNGYIGGYYPYQSGYYGGHGGYYGGYSGYPYGHY